MVPSLADSGTLWLRGTVDSVALGATTAASYSVRVIPGSYDLHYQVATPGALAPRNSNAKLRCLTAQ
jgi:hypothetical protein